MGHLAAAAADLARRAPGESGLALPRALPARTAGRHRGVVGRFGEQPPREVLSADESRTAAAGGGNRELGAYEHRGRARAAACLVSPSCGGCAGPCERRRSSAT